MTELENQYLEALRQCEEIGAQLVTHGHTSSRENSLSYTCVQESRLWFEKGIDERNHREKAKKQYDAEFTVQ